jgi:hypothetical protein
MLSFLLSSDIPLTLKAGTAARESDLREAEGRTASVCYLLPVCVASNVSRSDRYAPTNAVGRHLVLGERRLSESRLRAKLP